MSLVVDGTEIGTLDPLFTSDVNVKERSPEEFALPLLTRFPPRV